MLRITGIICAAGAVYYAVFSCTGYGIPCVFRLLTGYLCPGCGMTHAVTAILQGQFWEAWQYNALSLTILPALGIYLFYRIVRYIQGMDEQFRPWELVFLVLCTVAVISYGILRNVWTISGHEDGLLIRLIQHILPGN